MAHIANKIDAKDIKLQNVFFRNRYKIDVFQREYRWQREQIEALISDLCSSFLNNHKSEDVIASASSYDCYYMGPIVLCEDNNTLSIVDGQQRLTSFTLILIYLNHLQNLLDITDDEKQDLENYIFVKMGGKTTLVLNVEARNDVITQLYKSEIDVFSQTDIPIDYNFFQNGSEESLENIRNRYDDIVKFFPPEIKTKEIVPIFIEWLLTRIVLVEIKAYSLDNAYTIFETMNDRGLSLNPTEILKAYLLSNVKDENNAVEANEKWKQLINELKIQIGQDADLDFFKSWLRSKYALTRRGTFKGSENEDFEKIGVQFHAWVKTNHKALNLKTDTDFYYFILTDLEFYVNEYLNLYNWKHEPNEGKLKFNITNAFSIADSLVYPLFLAPIKKTDSKEVLEEKYLLVNDFLDVYVNIRMLCNKPITQSSIRNYFYDLIRDIRNKDEVELRVIFSKESEKLEELRTSFKDFYVDNQGYYHYLFARILYSIDEINDENVFNDLLRSRKQSSYILIQIYRSDEIENMDEEVDTTNLSNLISNFCLIRRYHFEEFSNKQMRHRLSFLQNNNYLPEMAGQNVSKWTILEFLSERNEVLNGFITHIWL